MSKWATPADFNPTSDGCSWWPILNDFLGRDRNKNGCRRHDFECRYGLYDWNDSRDYMMEYIAKENPWYLVWFRWPLIWSGLTASKNKCSDYSEPLPPEWVKWIDRNYNG